MKRVYKLVSFCFSSSHFVAADAINEVKKRVYLPELVWPTVLTRVLVCSSRRSGQITLRCGRADAFFALPEVRSLRTRSPSHVYTRSFHDVHPTTIRKVNETQKEHTVLVIVCQRLHACATGSKDCVHVCEWVWYVRKGQQVREQHSS